MIKPASSAAMKMELNGKEGNGKKEKGGVGKTWDARAHKNTRVKSRGRGAKVEGAKGGSAKKIKWELKKRSKRGRRRRGIQHWRETVKN